MKVNTNVKAVLLQGEPVRSSCRKLGSILLLLVIAVLPFWAQNLNNNRTELFQGKAHKISDYEKVTPEQKQALESLGPNVEVKQDDQGVPSFLMGHISNRSQADPMEEAKEVLKKYGAVFRRHVDDDFEYRLQENDDLGQTHVRMTQTYRGLPVMGGELIIHMDHDKIIGINGHFFSDLNVVTQPAITPDQAVVSALSFIRDEGGQNGSVVQKRTPVIFVDDNHIGHLAIPIQVEYVSAEGSEVDDVFVDAHNGVVLGHYPLAQRALFRRIYNADGNCVITGVVNPWLPGTFMFQEGQSSTDEAAMKAYENTGLTYDYYKTVFARDSYDGKGSPLDSTVHANQGLGCDVNNAMWIKTQTQLVFGNGDGVTYRNFASSLDITGHEITHAVTETTAGLMHWSEFGALDEATSDILGKSAAFWAGRGNWSTTEWTIGADVFINPGNALRHMYDPALDGSPDYYPNRAYPSIVSCVPSANNDQCGRHLNAGIANLFYYLLTVGGKHPRTGVQVTGIGLDKAQRIWYRALTTYMTSRTTFAEARTYTAKAAADLYGGACSPEWVAVHKAWDAVGVPGTTSCEPKIVWTNISASPRIWKMANTQVIAVDTTTACIGASEYVGGIGDFNGDGTPDLLCRDWFTGENTVYFMFMDGTSVTGSATLPAVPKGDWEIVGVGDFNADGKPDIVWRNSKTGDNYIWFMDGPKYINGTFLLTVADINWSIVGMADFNADGNPDIVWHNNVTGSNWVWYMDRSNMIGGEALPAIYDTAWSIVGIADFNRDGKPDILLRNYTTGENVVWYMDGPRYKGLDNLPPEADTQWRIEGAYN